jgi:hypothetical protein
MYDSLFVTQIHYFHTFVNADEKKAAIWKGYQSRTWDFPEEGGD